MQIQRCLMEGSIINRIKSRRGYLLGNEPKVGDGATYMAYSDRYPLTVIDRFRHVNQPRKNPKGDIYLKLQRDFAELVSGSMQSEGQGYKFSRNPNGQIYYVREVDVYEDGVLKGRIYEEVRKNEKGNFEIRNRKNRTPIVFEGRQAYYDPSF